MDISEKIYFENLERLLKASRKININSRSNYVIFSDLHLGDKSSTDDFKRNSQLFIRAIEHYRKNNFGLILNGDIEELQRFSLKSIQQSWPEIYEIFDHFNKKDKLIKTIGNHDLKLALEEKYPFAMEDSVVLNYKGKKIFILHGHQASKKYSKNNDLVGLSLKYLANPLGIKNFSVAHSSRKQYKIERRVYKFSNYNKIISVIGHTHRPLFESLSKAERLKIKIEQLCRELAETRAPGKKENLFTSIKNYKRELEKLYRDNTESPLHKSLYNEIFHVPSLFNSGTTIGKRGITCLEIHRGKIALIHWFNENVSKKYLRNTGYKPMQLADTPVHRMVINEEDLDYIFTRIEVMG